MELEFELKCLRDALDETIVKVAAAVVVANAAVAVKEVAVVGQIEMVAEAAVAAAEDVIVTGMFLFTLFT